MIVKLAFVVGAIASGAALGVADRNHHVRPTSGTTFAALYRRSFNESAAQDRIQMRIVWMSCADPVRGVYRCHVRVRMPSGAVTCGRMGVTVLHVFTYRHYEPCRRLMAGSLS